MNAYLSLVIIICLNCDYFATAASTPSTNTVPDFVWSKPVNQLQAGIISSDELRNQTKSQIIEVVVMSSMTNAVWGYIKPPSGAFAGLELKDPNGIPVVAITGKNLYNGPLPEVIPLADIPKTFHDSRHNTLFRDALHLYPNAPMTLNSFCIQDVYKIKEKGVYTLTVWPAIYKFSTNTDSATRVDLPSIAIQVSLAP